MTELKITKLSAQVPIHDVESVRLAQDMGYLDPGRDPEDLYREIKTGERHDPETQHERDIKRLTAAAAAILESTEKTDPVCIYCGKTFITWAKAEKLPKGKQEIACHSCGKVSPLVLT